MRPHWLSCPRRLGALIGLWLVAAAACDGQPPAGGRGPAGNSAAGAPSASSLASASPGTSASAAIGRRYERPELALRGLERHISNAERAIKRGSPDIAPRLALVSLYADRASRLGRIDDLDRVAALGDELITRYPKRPRAWLGRARALNTVHRFGAAAEALARARKLGSNAGDLRMVEASMLLGQGRYPEAHQRLKEQRALFPSTVNLTLEAVALGRLGRTDEAERNFEQALARYRDVSPLVPAWVAFERGNLWARAGDEQRATRHYREAVRLLPGYAHAAAHLAGSVDDDEAIPILTRLQQQSPDPEYPASLARLLEKREPARSAKLLQEALQAYDALLAKHELAFADHAAWFYLEVPERLVRAKELVAHAYAVRAGVPEIHELRLAVAMQEGKRARICTVARDAEALPHKTAGLKEWLEAAQARCKAAR